jgi:uncharacterized protein (DUF2141 family)
MTQAQQTHTGHSAMLPAAIAALVAVAALTVAILATGNFNLAIPQDGATAGGMSAAVTQSGQDWEAQRAQQAGAGAVSAEAYDLAIRLEAEEKQRFGTSSDTDGVKRPTAPTPR